MTAKIYETQNYGRFEPHAFNRDVKKTKALEASMKKHGFLDAYPLHIEKNGSKKLKIKAGNHRFYMAKRLGLGVKYVIGKDGATIHELEAATNPWSTYDYLGSFVRIGKDHYVVVQKFIDRTGIALSSAVSMLGGESAGSGNKMKAFKCGTYKTKPAGIEHAEIVADIVRCMENNGVRWATRSNVVTAISRIARVKQLSIPTLKEKIGAHTYLITKQPNLQSYIEMLERLYNRQSHNKIPLAFLANEVALDRCNKKQK